ncbi:Laminin subunit alpha-3 [Takifugu flavidus]|uniref:Laminin subunit alpha-3 n=1 Tax=Takifugu flavidus TaxID=433684 RepID=A0A5C6MTH2_9TELE|nr:Laminin subunit alpha-3 [Takifugu flavidus]
MECLCKRGYIGANCERCAFGYYGNPVKDGGSCKPCICKDNNMSICDPLTGECISSGDSGSVDGCRGESCISTLLVETEKWDDALVSVKQRLQNISADIDSISRLSHLGAHISETKLLLRNFSTSIKLRNATVIQLEGDAAVTTDDVSKIGEEVFGAALDLKGLAVKVNEINEKMEDLLSQAEVVIMRAKGLRKQLPEVKPGPSPTPPEQSKVVEAAQEIIQEVRKSRCISQRDKAVRGQEEAHTLLNTIRKATAADLQMMLKQSSDSLMASESSLRWMSELLADAADRADRLLGLNLRSLSVLGRVERLHPQLQREEGGLLHASETIRDLLGNVSDVLSTLRNIKTDFESHAAQTHGAKLELLTRLNCIFSIMAKANVVTEAEEHAEELHRVVEQIQQVFDNVTGSTVDALGIGPNGNIGNIIEEAEGAANQSSEVIGQTLEVMRAEDLVNTTGRLRDESKRLWTDVSETERDIGVASNTVKTWKDEINKQQDSLARNISILNDDLKSIGRDDTAALIESAKTAASVLTSTAAIVTERLRHISQEVEAITLTNGDSNYLLSEAGDACRNLSQNLPVLEDQVRHVEGLSKRAPPVGKNMTESIRKIKDVIEEARNLVNRLSFATIFNGKGHVELPPPRNLEDIKAFTVVDLLMNRHLSGDRSRRKRRRDKHRDGNAFVFYMGNRNTSGDYIGMALRHKVLIFVYKLGGLVHEVETSQITEASADSSNMDRVVFHRVYQDAEVHITKNFTSQQPVQLSPKRNLPNTTSGVLGLDPHSLVLYVGGYPEDFKPPAELDYPKFRGAMKVSYINDNPVSLFNYRRAVNMETTHLAVRMPRSEESDYYDGTGYRVAFIKDPKRNRRIFKFRTKSRETNALLFYIGNKETFFCLILEGGLLVLRGREAGKELRVQSAGQVSLFDQQFAVVVDDAFTVHYGPDQISAEHNQGTSYVRYYIGGLPASLRHRHNITSPPLRGCVGHVTANGESVEYGETLGVAAGCPVSLLGVRSATVRAPLSVDPLFLQDHQPLRVSVGFRSTHRYGTLIRSGSQASGHHFQLSLADGYAVVTSDNYTLRSDRRCNDGGWHYLFTSRSSTGLELRIDNIKVTQNQSPGNRRMRQNGGKFTGCISNLYTGSLVLPHGWKRPQEDAAIQVPAGSRCKPQREYQLSEDSWLHYIPEENLNHRPHFSLDIKTTSTKGLILHVAGAGAVPLLALYIANGKIRMSLGQNRVIYHKQRSNDGNWHRVQFSVEKSTFHLLVDGVRVTDGHLANDEGSSLDLHDLVYLGGDPARNTKGHNVPTNSIIGCIRNVEINEEVLREPEASHKTPPCFNTPAEMGTYFDGGYVISDRPLYVGSQFVLVFELRPHRLAGLLFHANNHKTSLNVFLNETEVGVEMKEGTSAVRVSVTPEILCDGEFHTVTVSRQDGVVSVTVDSVSEQEVAPPALLSTTLQTLHIGGTTKENQAPVSSPFVGCLRNVKLNGSPVAFEAESRVGHVISGCPAD